MGVASRRRRFEGFRCGRWLWAALLGGWLAAVMPLHATEVAAELVQPSVADPGIRAFDLPDVVLRPPAADLGQLVVFLPGTKGRPTNVLPLLRVVAGQGYRVIGLSYDDEPAVAQVCPETRDPGCSAAFRAMRSWGEGTALVSNPKDEAIAARLTAVLAWLDRAHPGQGWSAFVHGGQPVWSRIVLSGFSQGAGMAAFMAKRVAVARVVLFSSPWDEAEPGGDLAPWLSDASATPPERWWAARHARELTSALLKRAYRALGVPPAHIVVFDGDLPPGMPEGKNPYHGSTVRNLAYVPEWRVLFGG